MFTIKPNHCQGSKFIFGFGSTCVTGCKVLGTLPKFYFVGVQLRIFEAWLQILGAPISKENLALQEECLPRLLIYNMGLL